MRLLNRFRSSRAAWCVLAFVFGTFSLSAAADEPIRGRESFSGTARTRFHWANHLSADPKKDSRPLAVLHVRERPSILNRSDCGNAASVVTAFLADDHGRFVVEVEAMELATCLRARPKAPVSK